MYKDKISIIVPCYNIEKYVDRAISSIIQQTYSNLEIILVNDGSTDNTLTKMQELAEQDDRIHVIDKPNGGVTSARLCGVNASSGLWIGFMDGDDYIEPEMYERLMDNAKKHQADISHCGYKMVFPSRVDYYYQTGMVKIQDTLTGVKDLLEGKFVEPGLCNKLFRRDLFNELLSENKMDSSIKNYEDLLMNFYLFKEAKKSVYEDFCPYHYIIRENSAATAKISPKKLLDPLCVLEKIIDEVFDQKEIYFVVLWKKMALLISYATMLNCRGLVSVKKNALKELRKNWKNIINEQYEMRKKIRLTWVCILPFSYGVIHYLHSQLNGNYRKYKVE